MHPAVRTFRGSTLFLAILAVGSLAAPALAGGFAIDVDGTLYAFDCRSVKATRIGVVQAGRETPVLTDLGTDPRGALYGISEASLYAIDLKDPSRSRKVGDHGLAGPYGFCIAPDGTAYASTRDGGFYRVDLGTGRASLIGPLGGGFGASGDLVFLGKTLYGSLKDRAGVETLVTIDVATGAATKVGALKDRSGAEVMNVFGLMIEDGLYGLTSGGSVVRIDPRTAVATLVDWLPIRFWGATEALIEF